jgi:outer membrane receptor protein involved in Fe transport
MFKTLSTLLLFLLSLSGFSQNFSIVGTVVDENNQPISYSNVVIYITEDLSIIEGTITDDEGNFKFSNVKPNNYTLKTTYLGFEESSITINLIKNTNLRIIVLKEQVETLNDVTITAKRPTVKRMVDRLVFNVENSTLSNNNVLDVLKRTPGVMVHDGAITIKGSVPTVYINDRKVHLSSNEIQQLLEGTSASNIKSIEVISNPPAKYEAEGGAVLNIVTSKNITAGYNGSVFGNYKQGSEYPKYSFGTSHFLKTEKVNAYINYSISPRKDYRYVSESINFIQNNQVNSSWESVSEKRSESANQNINANIDYTLDENNSLGFSTSILVAPRTNTKTFTNALTEVFNSNSVLDSTFNTLNRLVDETTNLAFTLDYAHKFKTEGERLSVSVHHTNYDFSNFQNVDTDYFLPNNNLAFRNNRFQTFSSQEIKLYTAQLDYELPINDSSQFEAGLKVSDINSDNILTQYIFENGNRVEDLQNSDTFLYDEMNYAGYTSFSKDWGTWSFKSGLRVEYTDITGNSLSTNQMNKSDYVKFFPSFYILHKLNDTNELYFKYNKRIDRPRYSQLNPFKYFLNDNAYITGDPNLKPQIDDVYTLGYTFNKDYTFELYYRYENNPATQVTFQDNEDNKLAYRNTNIDRSISYGLDFITYTKVVPRWDLYAVSSLFYYDEQFFALESNNELIANNKWSVYAQIINYFTFLKDKSLMADVSYLFISQTVNGPTDVSTRSGLDINIKKTLWNNRASVSIGVTDIFNSQNFSQTTKYLNQDVVLKSRLENRQITFGFNYKFGNFRLQTNKKEIEINERDRLNSTQE